MALRRGRGRSWLSITVLVLAIVYGVASVLLGVVLGEVALHPPRQMVTFGAEPRARERVGRVGAQLEDVTLTTSDGVRLRAWFLTPRERDWNGHSVLTLHGVTDNREHGVKLATLLLEHGYRVLVPDARGHGDSGGIATYGVLERNDIRQWVAWLRARQAGGCVHGMGGSMGAAQLLQAIADPAEPTLFCDAIAESSFASFREVAFDRVGQRVGTGPWLGRTLLRPAVEVGFLSVRLQRHVNLGDADPARALRDTKTPVLLIHGLADRNMPLRHAYALAASNPTHATLWLVDGATHSAAWSAAPDAYPTRILSFFAAHEPHDADSRDGKQPVF